MQNGPPVSGGVAVDRLRRATAVQDRAAGGRMRKLEGGFEQQGTFPAHFLQIAVGRRRHGSLFRSGRCAAQGLSRDQAQEDGENAEQWETNALREERHVTGSSRRRRRRCWIARGCPASSSRRPGRKRVSHDGAGGRKSRSQAHGAGAGERNRPAVQLRPVEGGERGSNPVRSTGAPSRCRMSLCTEWAGPANTLGRARANRPTRVRFPHAGLAITTCRAKIACKPACAQPGQSRVHRR